MSVEVAAPPEETRPEVSAVNEEEEEDCIDFTALTEAQHAGADAAERRKRRAGTKESAKRRKRQKRENDILCVKQAGIALPSLHDVLKGNRKAIVIPSLKEALQQQNATDQESAPLAATPAAPAASPAMSQSAGEASSGSRPVNRGVCYDDLEDDPPEAAEDGGSKAGNENVEQTEAAPQVDQERLAVALKRVTKDSQRRVKAAQAANARSVFITNLPFKAKEDEIRDWLGPAGDIKGLRLNRDKATTKALGYGHVQFASPEAAENAVKQCDKIELHGRVMRVAPISDEKFQFELPEEIKEDLRNLLKEAYEGKNISTIKDAWQKRHPGQKLNTTKWGFKNFSTALKTLEGVTLEHHLEKTLTFLAFFDGSSKHKEFLEAKAKKASLGPATLTPGEAKRAAAEEKARHLQQLESAKANAAAAAAAMEAEVQKYAELIDRESAKLSESQAECETLRGTVAELQRAAELALATDPSASVSSLMDLPAKEPTTTNFFTAIKLERDPTAPPEAKEYMPRKPQHMALSADQLMRQRQWDEPQKWTLTIQEWDDVLNCCQDQPAYALFKTHGKKYVNMYDLNQEYVKKWTKGEGCGVAVMMSQHREDSAQLMLSHAWAEDVEECQSAVMEYVREKEVPRTAALWFCLFANYQVGDTSGPSIEAQLKMQPFSSVIKATSLARGEGYGLHAIHTSTADLYKRLWCVHEVERALVGNVDVSTSMSDKYKEQTLQRLEFFLSDSCSDSTWEDCMWAANVKVKTIQARCDRIEDEKMLIKGIMDTGGFERIDETIERFRAKTFGENYELMLKAVGRHGQALKFASFERLEQKLIHNLVLTAVRSSGMSLAHAPAQLKGKKELVMEAVKQNGMALQFAAEDMREDSEVVLQAVSQHGLALQFAEGPALENELVVLAAVAQDGEAFKLAPETMQTKKDIVEKAVLSSPKVLQYVPSELRKVALDAVKSSPQARAQLERSRMMAGIVNQTEQEIERMEELADTKRYVKNAEKTQERLQHAIELMKSVRPHVASQKPKKAQKLTLLALQTMLEHTQDPSLITKARTAVEKHFNSVVEDQKQDFLDFLFDRDVALSASLRDSIFACLVAYKHEMLSKAPLQIDTPMSQPLRRYSLAGASPSREPSKEPPIPERNSKRTVTEIAGLR